MSGHKTPPQSINPVHTPALPSDSFPQPLSYIKTEITSHDSIIDLTEDEVEAVDTSDPLLSWLTLLSKRAQDSLMQPPRSLLPSRQILNTEIIDVEEFVTKPSYMTSPTDSGVTSSGRNTRCSWIEGESSDGGLMSENDEQDVQNKKQKKCNGGLEAGSERKLDCNEKEHSVGNDGHHVKLKTKSNRIDDNISTVTETNVVENEPMALSPAVACENMLLSDTNKTKNILPAMFKFNMSDESKNLNVNKSIICDELVLSNSQSRIDQQFVSTESEVSLDGLDEETIVDKAVSAGLVEPTTDDNNSEGPTSGNILLGKMQLSPDIESFLTPAFDPDDMVNPEYKRTSTRPTPLSITSSTSSSSSTVEHDKLVDDTSRSPDDELKLRFPPIQRTYQNKKLSKLKESSMDCQSPVLLPQYIPDDVLTLKHTTLNHKFDSTTSTTSSSSSAAQQQSVIFSMTPNLKLAPLPDPGLANESASSSLASTAAASTSSTRLPSFGQVVFSTSSSNITSSIISDWSKVDDDYLIQSEKTDDDTSGGNSNHSVISNCGSQILCRHSYIKNDHMDMDDLKLMKATPILTRTSKGFTIQFKKEISPSNSLPGTWFYRSWSFFCNICCHMMILTFCFIFFYLVSLELIFFFIKS